MARLRHPLTVAILLSHVVFFVILGIRAMGLFQMLEFAVYDLMMWTRPQIVEPDSRITMVWCTDKDQRQWGWPLPDKEMVQLLRNILAHQPRVVGLDVYRDLPVPSSDGTSYITQLEELLAQNKNIIAITKLSDTKGVYVPPPPILQGTDQVGFNDVIADSGIIRRGLLFMDDGQQFFEYFGLRIALRYLEPLGIFPQQADQNHPELIRLGKTVIAPLDSHFGGYVDMDASGYQFMFDYPGAGEKFTSVTLTEVLSGQVDKALFHDKIVIIGTRAEGTPDFFLTPYSRWHKDEQRVTGAAIHAHAVRQLVNMALKGTPLMKSMNETMEIIWIWLWCLVGGLICLWISSTRWFILFICGGLVVLILTGYMMFNLYRWTPVIPPLFGWVSVTLLMESYISLREGKQKRFIQGIFGQYLSPHVIEVLIRDPSKLSLGGEKREMTAFFSDIEKFTTISENSQPEDLVYLLNEYLTEMSDIIAAYDGTIDKYIGDAVVAFWGAPLAQTDHAKSACFASIDMQHRLISLREKWMREGRPPLNVRIGLNSGSMIVGNMGSDRHMNYTVMGDAVNLAARLEGVNKFYHTHSIISEYTYHQCADFIDVRQLDTIRVAGKRQAVTIYELLGKKNHVRGKTAEMVDHYTRGLELYIQGRFDSALKEFETALRVIKNDGPSKIFKARCQNYLENPPPQDWDGVFNYTQKG